MRLLGLGSPDKVPPLTEKAAIDLGADVLSELFVFGSAVAAILLEYYRQNRNKNLKAEAFEQKVDDLDLLNSKIFQDVELNMKSIDNLKNLLKEQSNDIKKINKKLDELDEFSKRQKQQTKLNSTQTTNERPIGKIIIPSKFKQKASSDPTNSILYQSADDACFIMTKNIL